MSAIERIIINFSSKCSLHCPYCFIPFNNSEVRPSAIMQVLDRCSELGAKVITFGGGDPFQYKFLPEIIEAASNLDFSLHIDTNGIGLTKADYSLLENHNVLLGLSLDSHIKEIHIRSREEGIAFSRILAHLEELKNTNVRVKVNTLATPINAKSLCEMARFLCQCKIDIWSLYQYLPILSRVGQENVYQLSEVEFRRLIDEIKKLKVNYTLEPGFASQRSGTYLFVSHNGEAYIHNPVDKTKYMFLGSIHKDETISRFLSFQKTTMRNGLRDRYLFQRAEFQKIDVQQNGSVDQGHGGSIKKHGE